MKKSLGEEGYNRLIPMVVSRGHTSIFDFLMATAKEPVKTLVELYPSLPPEQMTVRYALKPLAENPEIFEVPASEFCAIAGLPKDFRWTNSIYLPSNVKMHLQNNPIRGIDPAREQADELRSQQLKVTYADKRITSMQEAPYVICKIDDVVGWGVFTDRDLPENLFVSVYSGKVQLNTLADRNDDHFRMELVHKIFDCSPENTSFEVGCVSAREMGNLTRFLNAMPTQEQVQHAKCDPQDMKDNIAIANCTYQHGTFDNVPAQFVVTKRAIKRGEQLGIPYWQFQKNFGLFNKKTGRLMPDVKLLSTTAKETSSVLVQFYHPKVDKILAIKINKTDFRTALLKNHLSFPDLPQVNLIHADYIRHLATHIDQAQLEQICGDKWPEVKRLQAEFLQDEIKMVPALLEGLCHATFNEWKQSASNDYHHFELRVSLEEAQQLHECFVQGRFGHVKLEQEKDGVVLHWHEDPFQDIALALKTLQQQVISNFGAGQVPSELKSI